MVEPEQDKTVEERLAEIANATGSAVLALNAGIGPDSFGEVVSALGNIGAQETLSLILNSPGGSIEYAFRIAKAVRANCEYLEVIVPARAKSAATLISLAADRILFGRFGELGPLDPQVPDFTGGLDLQSPLKIIKGLEFMRNYYVETFDVIVQLLLRRSGMDIAHALDYVSDLLSPIAEPLYSSVNYGELGEAARHLAVSEEYAKETLLRWSPLDASSSESIVRWLVWEYPDHGYIIDIDEARSIGLTNVDTLDLHREGLCYMIFGQQKSFVVAALPDDADHINGSNDAAMTIGGDSGSEADADYEQ